MRLMILALAASAFVFTACDKPDPPVHAASLTPAPPAAPPPTPPAADTARKAVDTVVKAPPSAPPPAPAPKPKSDGMTSTLSGVYSAEQAKRGESAYGSVCASCHNSLGNHTGPIFRQRWVNSTLGDLFVYMQENMPKGDPGSLSPQEYADLTAYLMKANGMPEGKTALPPDAVALSAIRIDTLAGSSK